MDAWRLGTTQGTVVFVCNCRSSRSHHRTLLRTRERLQLPRQNSAVPPTRPAIWVFHCPMATSTRHRHQHGAVVVAGSSADHLALATSNTGASAAPLDEPLQRAQQMPTGMTEALCCCSQWVRIAGGHTLSASPPSCCPLPRLFEVRSRLHLWVEARRLAEWKKSGSSSFMVPLRLILSCAAFFRFVSLVVTRCDVLSLYVALPAGLCSAWETRLLRHKPKVDRVTSLSGRGRFVQHGLLRGSWEARQ